jgi:general secretion pathway protein F
MAVFRYKAMTTSGEALVGELEGESAAVVIARLRDLGHLPFEAKELGSGVDLRSWLERDLFDSGRLTTLDLVLVTRELGALLKAGIPLEHAFEILLELFGGKRVTKVLGDVLQRLRRGQSLADALAAQGRNFPQLYISMVRAGEAGGAALPDALLRLSDFLQKSQALREQIKSALVYPTLLLVMTGGALVFVQLVVLPQFQPLFAEARAVLPLTTRIVIAAGAGFQNYWWLGLSVMLAAGVAARFALQRPSLRFLWHKALLRLPIIADLIVKTDTARLSRTLGSLLANGVSLPAGLALARESVSNLVLDKAIEHAASGLREGASLSAPLDETRLFPKLATRLMRVGEETGRLDEMLLKLADSYERDVQRIIERLLALLVPAITITLGIVIATVIASVLVAILSVNALAV